jgi:hypothetical protein
MATLNDWLRSIAAALNDDEPGRPFQRYAVRDMLAAYNAAMCLVARYRADMFTELKVVSLQAGKYQDVRGCCAQVLDVLDQTDEHGNVLHELKGSRAKATTAQRIWKKPSCLAPVAEGEYRITSVDIDPNLSGRFTVHPPVPCNTDAYVRIKCVAAPCALTEENLESTFNGDCTMHEAAWHYVLAKMLTGDRFANGAGGDKAYHFRMFFDILGIVQRQDDRIDSKEQA